MGVLVWYQMAVNRGARHRSQRVQCLIDDPVGDLAESAVTDQQGQRVIHDRSEVLPARLPCQPPPLL